MNITAFMNLMVILVPFLLITAVFSRLAVLELALPTDQSEAVQSDDPTVPLTVVVRADRLIVQFPDASTATVDDAFGEHDLNALTDLLVQVKERTPEDSLITLRFEPDTDYDVMIGVMDAVRQTVRVDASTGRTIRSPLFPQISIGDAPAEKARADDASAAEDTAT